MAELNLITASNDVTDADLIAAARGFNESSQFHLRKNAEDFWRMGEVLDRLYQRPTAHGRWRKVLAEIGINHTSANQAQRLFKAIDLEGLAKYRNKTHALRDLGILKAAPKEGEQAALAKVSTEAPKSSPQGAPDNKIDARSPVAEPTITKPPVVGVTATADRSTEAESPTVPAAPTDDAGIRVGEGSTDAEGEGHGIEPSQVAKPKSDPLEVLVQVAARLEYLAGEEFEMTPEFSVQVERAAKALDLLRKKEVVHVAA